MEGPSHRTHTTASPPDTCQTSSPSVNAIKTPSTHGLRDSGSLPEKQLWNRDSAAVEPKSGGYVKRLLHSVASGGQVAGLFVKDLITTTYATFNSAWNASDKIVPELVTFGSGIACLGAALTQAAAVKTAKTTGLEVTDGLSILLNKAGVKVSGIDLNDISNSLVKLSAGFSQSIHLPDGQFSLKHGDNQVTIKNLHLKNLQPISNRYQEATEKRQLGTSADQLSFTIEYTPKQGLPTQLAINIKAPKFTNSTNLLAVLGELATGFCATLLSKHFLIPDPSISSLKEPETHSPFNREKSHFDFQTDGVVIKVETAGSLLKHFAESGESIISLNDIHFQKDVNFFGSKSLTKPTISLGLIETDHLMTGPLKLQSGYLRLDADLSGELVCTLMADYKIFDKICPSWIPDSIRKSVTGTDASKQHAAVRLGIKVVEGIIDLNSIQASGIKDEGLTHLQKLIQISLIETLKSHHTRVRPDSKTGSGFGSELKFMVSLKKPLQAGAQRVAQSLLRTSKKKQMSSKPESTSPAPSEDSTSEIDQQANSSLWKRIKKTPQHHKPVHVPGGKAVKRATTARPPVKVNRNNIYIRLPKSDAFIASKTGKGKISLSQIAEGAGVRLGRIFTPPSK